MNFNDNFSIKYIWLVPKDVKILDIDESENEIMTNFAEITKDCKWSDNLPKQQSEEPKPIHD